MLCVAVIYHICTCWWELWSLFSLIYMYYVIIDKFTLTYMYMYLGWMRVYCFFLWATRNSSQKITLWGSLIFTCILYMYICLCHTYYCCSMFHNNFTYKNLLSCSYYNRFSHFKHCKISWVQLFTVFWINSKV